MGKYIVVDTETTGMGPESQAVEAAAVCRETGEFYHSLIHPTVPIEFPAMATHHITEEMVREAPPLVWVEEALGNSMDVTEDTFVVAHNAEFDKKYLPSLSGKRWICTWRCSRHLLPDAQSHKNQSLRYELGLPVTEDMPAELGGLAHRAGYDSWCTDHLLQHLLGLVPGHSLEELYELQSRPVLLKKCDFGKHRGSPWAEVPPDYLQYVLRQDFDDDVKHTARYWMEQRTGRKF